MLSSTYKHDGNRLAVSHVLLKHNSFMMKTKKYPAKKVCPLFYGWNPVRSLMYKEGVIKLSLFLVLIGHLLYIRKYYNDMASWFHSSSPPLMDHVKTEV